MIEYSYKIQEEMMKMKKINSILESLWKSYEEYLEMLEKYNLER